jgi:hypothetical protein
MIPNRKLWDKEKIETLFPMHIVNCIMETPLLNLVEDDKLVWSDSIDGNYSVKSGYKLLMHANEKIDMSVQRGNWLSIWKIHAPPKAKHLLWRICRGCLPSRVKLQEKHVPCQISCPLCDNAFEDDWHAILTCISSVQARQAAGLESLLLHRIQQASTLQDFILDVCTFETKEVAGLFAMPTWVLWQNRNNKIWHETHETGRNLGLKARSLWEEWRDMQQVQIGSSNTAQQQQRYIWEKPRQGWYKCNVDAGFHKELNKTSTVWCLRDRTGSFVMAETT